MKLPQQAREALNVKPPNLDMPRNQQLVNVAQPAAQQAAMPPIATECFMLSNMFDPVNEREPAWDQEIRDDVVDECNKHGGCSTFTWTRPRLRVMSTLSVPTSPPL